MYAKLALLAFVAAAAANNCTGGATKIGMMATEAGDEACHICACGFDEKWSCDLLPASYCGQVERRSGYIMASNATTNGTTANTTTTITQEFEFTITYGQAPDGVTAGTFLEDTTTAESTMGNVTDSVSDFTALCMNDVDCLFGEDVQSRGAVTLSVANGLMKVQQKFKFTTKSKKTLQQYMNENVQKMKDDLNSAASKLRKATPKSGAWKNLKASDISASAEPLKKQSTRAVSKPADDDLSAGAIVAIVIGSLVFVAIVVAAVIFATKKPAENKTGDEACNEPIDEPVPAQDK